jgi:hypothetical protein
MFARTACRRLLPPRDNTVAQVDTGRQQRVQGSSGMESRLVELHALPLAFIRVMWLTITAICQAGGVLHELARLRAPSGADLTPGQARRWMWQHPAKILINLQLPPVRRSYRHG